MLLKVTIDRRLNFGERVKNILLYESLANRLYTKRSLEYFVSEVEVLRHTTLQTSDLFSLTSAPHELVMLRIPTLIERTALQKSETPTPIITK